MDPGALAPGSAIRPTNCRDLSRRCEITDTADHDRIRIDGATMLSDIDFV